jgi:hypothetical protein
MERSEVPLFVIVTVEAEVFPTGMLPKFTEFGATEITGSA